MEVDGLLTSGLPLLELPAALKEQGIETLELCHFHLPSTDPDYLAALRASLDAAGVQLFSLLIDTGDVAALESEARAQDVAEIQHYLRVATALGAERVRISAGRQPATAGALSRSAAQLTRFVSEAAAQGLKVSTENWQLTAQQPEDVLSLLAACPAELGLCADTGNAEATPDKYRTLTLLLPHATSVHFKALRHAKGIDRNDMRRCLKLMREAAFSGPLSLIYDGKTHEWEEIDNLRAALQDEYDANRLVA